MMLNQLEFPGMPERRPVPPRQAPPREEVMEYPPDGAHFADLWGGGDDALSAVNPIYERGTGDRLWEEGTRAYREGRFATRTETEFIPPWRVISEQYYVNPHAIDHQVRHANPLALQGGEPEVYAINDSDEETYVVTDGNHRVNAAQRRGQLLMPADVVRMVEAPRVNMSRYLDG